MAERKVLNKYFDPYFNHEKLEKRRPPKVGKQYNVRMMMPFSMRCNTCGNYIYIGTKFNMRLERVIEENYLGIAIFRFYLKCTSCHAECAFKTDPQNSDYVVELGATRNYEQWRDVQNAEEELRRQKEDEEEGNAMKFLENKTVDSKREMDIMDAIDEIKNLNKRHHTIPVTELLGKFLEDPLAGFNDDDMEAIEGLFSKKKVKRIQEDEYGNLVQDEEEKQQEHQNLEFLTFIKEKNDDKLVVPKLNLKTIVIRKTETNLQKEVLNKQINTDLVDKLDKPLVKSIQVNKKIPTKLNICDYSDDD